MGNGITNCYPDEVYNFISITVLRFHEKGGKSHEVPADHHAPEGLDAHFAAGEIEAVAVDAAGGLDHDQAGDLPRGRGSARGVKGGGPLWPEADKTGNQQAFQ